VEKLQDRIIFPIRDITGKTVVYVARHTLSNGNPRYINYPSKMQIPLFPPQIPSGHKSWVLVEGIFDMLNLYDKGLKNVTCTFFPTNDGRLDVNCYSKNNDFGFVINTKCYDNPTPIVLKDKLDSYTLKFVCIRN
jgi:hypothetical protein